MVFQKGPMICPELGTITHGLPCAKFRLQNSRIFCERERRTIFERKVWSECKNGEGEREARALHTRGSRLRRFPPSENDCFAV